MRARTCADEEHVVDPLVQGVDPVHRQPGEVDALGEQQGASQDLVRHQWVLLGEVERGVGQQQRAVVAVLPVVVGDALAERKREEAEEEEVVEGHEEEERKRKTDEASLLQLSQTQVEATPPLPPSSFHCLTHLRLPRPLPLLPFQVIS